MAKSDDLAAQLAADLAAEVEPDRAAEYVPPRSPRSPGSPGAGNEPSVEAALFLAPRSWQRPRITREGRSLTIGGGPVRVRIRRGSTKSRG